MNGSTEPTPYKRTIASLIGAKPKSYKAFPAFGPQPTSSPATMVAAMPAAGKAPAGKAAVKLLCRYGGRILPRQPDGRLRYVGGETRLVSLPRSAPVSELFAKFPDLCDWPVSLRCQLPEGDLDELVTVTSDEDLANVVEEYDRAADPSLKIRAFLFSGRPKTPSPSASVSSSPASASPPPNSVSSPPARLSPAPSGYLRYAVAAASSNGLRLCCMHGGHLVHHGNHWQ